jgi:predicted Ser/Thr protein kinase
MSEPSKDLLPDQWWAVADCVDAYESQAGEHFPDLRPFAERVPPDYRRAALAELVKVDLERRYTRGQGRRIEDYLREYPELSAGGSVEELVQQEYLVRSRHGEHPSMQELRSRFPQLDERKVLESEQVFAATIQFGVNPLETQQSQSESSPAGPSGTMVFDTAGASGSTAAPASSPPPKAPAAPPRAAARTALPGAIGRYTVKQELGAGSFGVVYRCFDEDLKRDVAIKLPHQGAKITRQRVQEFMHEARSAARLRHAGIVTVLDTNQTDDGRVYIVYEFIRGQTLQDRMDAEGYSHEDAARWTAEAAEALHHAHKNQIVHRDVKPANLLLDEDGHVHVADFGLAKMDDQFFKDDTGRVLGTIAYMSPEQAAGQSHWASPQADIYSLGVMFYQMLCRRLPFSPSSVEDALAQIKSRVPAPPRTIDDKIPKELEAICLKAMAKSPADRYTTAADLAADLRRAVAGEPPARDHRRTWLAAGGAAAAVVVLAVVFSRNGRDEPAPPPSGSGARGTARGGADGSERTVPPGSPQLALHVQSAGESGVWRPFGGRQMALREGDKVQLHVALDRPRYVYLYWFNAQGEPDRLWPKAADGQRPTAKLQSPPGNDEWWTIDAKQGAEMALVAVRDEPLSAGALAEFESRLAFGQGEIRMDEVFHVASPELERGLAGVVTSRKNPLAKDFEAAVRSTFSAFHGVVVPHR